GYRARATVRCSFLCSGGPGQLCDSEASASIAEVGLDARAYPLPHRLVRLHERNALEQHRFLHVAFAREYACELEILRAARAVLGDRKIMRLHAERGNAAGAKGQRSRNPVKRRAGRRLEVHGLRVDAEHGVEGTALAEDEGDAVAGVFIDVE